MTKKALGSWSKATTLLDDLNEYNRSSLAMVANSNNPNTNTIALMQGLALLATMLAAIKYEMEAQTRLLSKIQSDVHSIAE